VHSKAYHIFTHKDLDGAVSLLTFIWSHPNSIISYEEITNLEIVKIKQFIKKTINPPNIVILDLAIREEFISDLDHNFITIIDHHERSIPLISKFKNAKIYFKNVTSNSLLVRKLYQDICPPLSENQKKLILYADDYDCLKLKHEHSYDLNIIFWNQFKNNFSNFINKYKNGFLDFDENQKKLLFDVKQKIKNEEKNLKIFKGDLKIDLENKKILAVSINENNPLLIDYLIYKYDYDLFIIINIKNEKVKIRQKINDNPINLKKFCEKYCDGDATTFLGIGKITPLFLELTKNFIPL
jgi:hypothetical protein